MFLGGVKADPVALIVEAARGEFFFRQPVEVQLPARDRGEDLGQGDLDEAGFVNGELLCGVGHGFSLH